MKKTCTHCKKTFTLKSKLHPKQRFCSRVCQFANWKEKNSKRYKDAVTKWHREYRIENKEEMNVKQRAYRLKKYPVLEASCSACGGVFLKKPKNRIYCSKRCISMAFDLRNPSKRKEQYAKKYNATHPLRGLVCPTCKKQVQTRLKNKIYCSSKCVVKAVNARKTSEQKRKESALWKERYPEKFHAHMMRRQKRLHNAKGTHTKKEWDNLKKNFDYRCYICNQQEPFEKQYYKKLVKEHVIALVNGGANDIRNVKPACWDCNAKKSKQDKISNK